MENLRQILIEYTDSIRAYEHESHNLIGHDERESHEFVDIFLKERMVKDSIEESNCNLSDVIKSVCDQTCPYWGYQCNINRMFEECKKKQTDC